MIGILALTQALAGEPLVGTVSATVRAGSPLDLAAPGFHFQVGVLGRGALVRTSFGTRIGADRFPVDERIHSTLAVAVGPIRTVVEQRRWSVDLFTVTGVETQRRQRVDRPDTLALALTQSAGAVLLAGPAGLRLEVEAVIGPRDGGLRAIVGPTVRF